MLTFAKNIFVLTLSIFFTGCLFDSSEYPIIGKYKLLWIDLPENQSLCIEPESNSNGGIPVILPYVFVVGHNDSFIIAKQHPTNGFEGGYKVFTDTTNYYIIDLTKKNSNILGAFNSKQFDSAKVKLRIENLQFDKIYLDNP